MKSIRLVKNGQEPRARELPKSTISAAAERANQDRAVLLFLTKDREPDPAVEQVKAILFH